jgi:nicotinate-nucleotide adenylyltransferase
MRVGIFGGTFDPVHFGHLILAEQAREQGRLDEVWFVPAPCPPQKTNQVITPYDQRVEMLQLAIAGHPAFRIDLIEKDLPSPSYTVNTLDELRRRHPDAELWLLIGGDSLVDLPEWYQPIRIIRQAGLLVMARPGAALLSADELRTQLSLPEEIPLRLQIIQVTSYIEISSTDLRQRVREGRSIRYFLPRAVEVYIQEKHLYRGKDD